MRNTVQWLVSGRVLLVTLADEISLASIAGVVEEILQTLPPNGAPSSIHIVFDSTTKTTVAPDLLNVPKALHQARMVLSCGMIGHIVGVDPDPHPAGSLFGGIITGICNLPFVILPTKREALSYFNSLDTDENSLPQPRELGA